MIVHKSRARLGIALALAAALAGGCGPYKTFTGEPKAFATHPFRITYPATWLPADLPQMQHDLVILRVFAENIPVAPNSPASPAMIFVRALRIRQKETAVTFMERYYDYLAPRFLDVKMRKLGQRQGAEVWEVTAGKGGLKARVFVLPREGLAYDVTVAGTPKQWERFAKQFQTGLDSFQLLPAQR
jgi:hypothetical protein